LFAKASEFHIPVNDKNLMLWHAQAVS